jgi:hypothetical protein
MKKSLSLLAAATVLAGTLHSADITQDFEASYNASSGARTNMDGVVRGNVSEQNTHFKYVFSYAVPDVPIVRVGVGYDRYDFGFAGPGLIPSTMQSVNLVAGIDLKLWDILMRIETQPGFYGDTGLSGSDFNIPIIFGASYLLNKDFQLIAGLSFDPNRDWPVLGGLGFRWKLSDRWVLNITPPNPRVEYKATEDVTLYAGGQIISSTYRVNDLGVRFGRSFNNVLVNYTEIRAGAGASWKFAPKGTLEVELGCMAYRDFDYYKVGDNFETRNASIYGQAGLKFSF